ncbi:RNA-binding family protein isoform 1 [Theobroma cacao]|uniref:RNA-binding family protein isoform 1 n=1 Tax=Theobroma cacao TaxID=3641 RepID=A0A061G6K6_THECC|nr:RNA-binding family protein isoform 1 [Theobroma cacao]
MSSVSSFPFVLIASSWASFGFDSGRTLFLFSLSVLSLQSEVGFLFAVCLNLSLFLYLFFAWLLSRQDSRSSRFMFSLQIKTVKVSNVSLGATQRDVKEFFSFSGDIEYVEMQSDNEQSQVAYVTFKDSQGAETAVLLTGAIIVDLSVSITLAPDYKLPPAAFLPPSAIQNKTPGGGDSAIRKAEDVVSGMLAKGFILGKDAVNKAKTFDEKHQLTSTASAKVASFDKKIGFTEKITAGTTVVSGKVREVDQKFQVSEKTKSAFAAAEQKVSSAGSAIMKNRYVFTGASWVTGAFNKVAKAAGDVGQKTKEKVGEAEEERKRKVVDDFAQIHLSESPKASAPSEQPLSKPAPAQGLI